MPEPTLLIAAFWTNIDPDDATQAVSDALNEDLSVGPRRVCIKGSGAVVSLTKVDNPLRSWLRAVHIEEAADFTPPSKDKQGRA